MLTRFLKDRTDTLALALLVLVVRPAPMASGAATAAVAAPDFTREVRPILSRHCFKCHGPDDATRKGRLRLDQRDDALKPAKSGATALVPGKPTESELIKRIETTSADDVMPPPETKQSLTTEHKEILRRWVQSGAEYRQHWAFVPPKAQPPTGLRHGDWVRNPVDAFVLERLERAGLEPSPEADPVTLVRRLSLDLVGLPPTPAQVESFAKAYAANPRAAVEGWVDELLVSPRYGERWARRWLDLARYADTNGYEKDRQRNIWPYRDWVIRALNADLSFDQFTIWQLAGDLLRPEDLPPGTDPYDPLIATGFHRNTMLNEEGGIDPLEFRFHAMVDRVATTGTAWLGLTLQCAQCHTHKYDPVTQREYYQLMACLNNADEPDLDLPDPKVAAEHARNLERAKALIAGLPEKWPIDALVWQTPRPSIVAAASGQAAVIQEDNSALFPAETPDFDTQTFYLETEATEVAALRVEALTHASLPAKGPGRVSHGNFVLGEVRITAEPRAGAGDPVRVRIIRAEADVEQADHPARNAFDGKSETGWAVHLDNQRLNANHQVIFHFEKTVGFAGGTRFTVALEQKAVPRHTIGRPRLSLGVLPADQRPLAGRRREAVENAFQVWVQRERERLVAWQTVRPAEMESNLPLLRLQPDGSVLASGDISKSDTYTLKIRESLKGATAIRLEALPDDSLPAHGPGLTYYEGPKGDFFLGEFQVEADGRRLSLTNASDSYNKNNFGSGAPASAAIDGDPQTGWSCAGRFGVANEAVFRFAEPLRDAKELQVRMFFGRHYACSLGRFRVSITRDNRPAMASPLSSATQQLLQIAAGSRTPEQTAQLREAFLLGASELAPERAEIERLRQPPAYQTTLVMRERLAGQVRPTFVHKRGEYLQPTDKVEPGVIQVLNPVPRDATLNRLAFARWLAARENPLTARVTVNRAWLAFFGRGIVRTAEDFGLQGEAPSHPELLDWLALDFMDNGWSLKKLHRRIVTSATYLQASRVRPLPNGMAVNPDPDNRLLSHFPRTRLDGEILRDSALLASGLLSTRMYGPGVYPPQPEGITEVTFGQPKWPASQGEDRHRRSVYTFIKRTAPFALYNTFDAPSGEACLARREISNTPLQALSVLNDIVFIEASQALGRTLAAEAGSVEDRIVSLFRRCLSRTPSPEETRELAVFFRAQLERFKSGATEARQIAGQKDGDASERAAWTALARVLLNLDESLTKG